MARTRDGRSGGLPTRDRSGPWGLLMLACVLVVAASTGCGVSKRAVRSEQELTTLNDADMALAHQQFAESVARMIDRVAAEPEPVLNLLALSGGGDKGAFGAGVLVSWGRATDPAHRRPVFDAVSGVSTGSMLAPFAFVGTDEACDTVEGFYRNPRKDWVRSRGPLFFLPSNPSFATINGLERDVVEGLTPAFIDQMVRGSDEGRLLAVSSTNVEMGTQRVWELGHFARLAQRDGDPTHVSNLMLASSSIPAAFPPREINGFLHTDGGVTCNILVRLDPDAPDGFLQQWRARFPGRPLPRVRYWIIFNDQVTQAPATVQRTWPSVLTPAIATSIRSATMSEIRWLAAQARYINEAYDADIEVRMIAIPASWRPPAPGVFIQETMVSMADAGRAAGADPSAWQVLADGKP